MTRTSWAIVGKIHICNATFLVFDSNQRLLFRPVIEYNDSTMIELHNFESFKHALILLSPLSRITQVSLGQNEDSN